MDHKNPWSSSEWVNRGAQMLDKKPALAQKIISKGIQLDPEEAISWFNLGIGLHQQGKINSAIRAYKHCLALPHDQQTELAATNNLAQDLLLNGNETEGWELYAARFKRKPGNYNLFTEAFGQPLKGELEKNHKLILMCEQGLGDTIQFVRYAMLLQAKGHKVTLLSQPALVNLLNRYGALENVIDKIVSQEHNSKNTCWLPLMDIGQKLQALNVIPPYANGYLNCKQADIDNWQKRLLRDPNKRLIALHWQGNPNHEGSLYSRGRSMAFSDWLPLKHVKNLEFVSIQKGPGSEQLKLDQGLNFVKGQAEVSETMEFCDTAAILKNCDLLLSADSGVVHLAGALGVPAWVALRWIPEWRWGLEGCTTPWYSSLRLFRQTENGNWQGVVEAMVEKLRS